MLQVVQCERAAIGLELEDADVVVPLMSRLDAALLQSARRCKLVLQFGVGVEGVDIQEASQTPCRSPPPASACGRLHLAYLFPLLLC